MGMIDKRAIEKAALSMIKALGDDPTRESLRNTPKRIADMYGEIFAGIDKDAAEEMSVEFQEGHREMVILRNISFYSMCEHHLFPFYGVVHVGYIPNTKGKVVGISKLARVVDIYAKRLQLQERMTTQIADSIMNSLQPDGVAVIVRAEHLCMIMRGIEKPGSYVITSAMRGLFRSKTVTRTEFLSLVQSK
jgi:GTP cyclohydrolase I